MNVGDYDEDLGRNPFFEALRREDSDLFRRVLSEKLYILVPKRESLKNLSIDDQNAMFKRHIVRLDDRSEGETGYRNLDGEPITTSNDGRVLTLSQTDAADGKFISVRILFEETYFTEEGASCKLICISRPLISAAIADDASIGQMPSRFDSASSSSLVSPSTSSPLSPISPSTSSFIDPMQCYERVLFHDDIENRFQRQLRKNLNRFAERLTNEYKSVWHFQQLKSLVREEFYVTFRDVLVRKRGSSEKLDDQGISLLQISTEIFFYRCIHNQLLNFLCACVRDDESSLNRQKYAASELVPSDWGIAPELFGDLPNARKQLAKLNEIDNPYGKLLCLRKTIAALTSNADAPNLSGKRAPISTDDLIPPLAFLIAKSNIFTWITNILYITEFHFSSFANDELGYCLASFEAAAQFIKDGSMKSTVVTKWQDWALGKALNNNQEKNVVLDIMEKEIDDPNVASVDYWECVIAALQSNEESAVRDCLHAASLDTSEQAGQSTLVDESHPNDPVAESKKCHPLCECSNCLKSRQRHADSITLVTAQEFSALHFASLFGQTSMLHYLIRTGGKAIIDKADEQGRTPLHWACRMGSQSCTLLLLHHGAQSHFADNVGNTALHLATYYGYVDCVKALLYFNQQVRGSSAQVNAINHAGESALHIAVRFHHVDIVSVLLECGANAKLRDKRAKTPFDICDNFESRRLLAIESPFAEVAPLDSPSQISTNISSERGSTSSIGATGYESSFSISSALIDLNIEKIDKLLKAIADDDLPLVKHYLADAAGASESQPTRCHPLCQCPKCQDLDEDSEDGLNVNATGSNGLNALHTAVKYSRFEIVRYLLVSCDADVNWPSAADGRTALHFGASSGNLEIVHLLLDRNADLYARDSMGDSPLELLASSGNAAMLSNLAAKYDIKGIIPTKFVNDKPRTSSMSEQRE